MKQIALDHCLSGKGFIIYHLSVFPNMLLKRNIS